MFVIVVGTGRAIRLACTVLVLAALVTGCSGQRPASLDTAAIESAIAALDDVDDVEVGVVNVGAPGSYSLDTDITIDDPDRVRDVLVESARILAGRAGDVGRYTFKVAVPATSSTFPYSYVDLEQQQTLLGFDGAYLGSTLEVDGDQLRRMVAAG